MLYHLREIEGNTILERRLSAGRYFILRVSSLAIFWAGIFTMFWGGKALVISYSEGHLWEDDQNIIEAIKMSVGLFLLFMGRKLKTNRATKLAMFDGSILHVFLPNKKPAAFQAVDISRLELLESKAYDDLLEKRYPTLTLSIVKRSEESVPIAAFYNWAMLSMDTQGDWATVSEEARRASKGLAKAIGRPFRVGKK